MQIVTVSFCVNCFKAWSQYAHLDPTDLLVYPFVHLRAILPLETWGQTASDVQLKPRDWFLLPNKVKIFACSHYAHNFIAKPALKLSFDTSYGIPVARHRCADLRRGARANWRATASVTVTFVATNLNLIFIGQRLSQLVSSGRASSRAFVADWIRSQLCAPLDTITLVNFRNCDDVGGDSASLRSRTGSGFAVLTAGMDKIRVAQKVQKLQSGNMNRH